MLKEAICNVFALLLGVYMQTNASRTTPATQPSGHSQPAVLQTSVEPTPQVWRPLAAAFPKSWAGECEGALTGLWRHVGIGGEQDSLVWDVGNCR